jgi:hypothetical protein
LSDTSHSRFHAACGAYLFEDNRVTQRMPQAEAPTQTSIAQKMSNLPKANELQDITGLLQ